MVCVENEVIRLLLKPKGRGNGEIWVRVCVHVQYMCDYVCGGLHPWSIKTRFSYES